MKLAVVVGIYNVFPQACVMLSSLKANLRIPFDLIVIQDGLTADQKFILEKWYGATRFIDFTEFKDTRLGDASEFTHMTMARYECFGLLGEYNQVCWIDVDILVRRDITPLFNPSDGMVVIRESNNLEMNFKDGIIPPVAHIEPRDKEKFFNAGFFILNDSIRDPEEIRDWCYETTYEYIDYLRFPDQGVLNLAAIRFAIPLNNAGLSYNYSINYRREPIGDPHLYHYFCYPKPWEVDKKSEAEELHGVRWVEEWLEREKSVTSRFAIDKREIHMVSTIGGDVSLLPQWLNHYHNEGVGSFFIVINAKSEDDPIIEEVKGQLSNYFHQTKILIGEFSEEKKTALERELIEDNCSRDDWVVYADLDEFHEYPVSLPVLLRGCRHKDVALDYLTTGEVIDRIAEDGSFPELEGDLNTQFPLRCRVTKGIAGAVSRKIIVARAKYRVWFGHHDILVKCPQNDPPDPACPIRMDIDPRSHQFGIVVNHFKWHAGGIRSMSDRMKRYGQPDVEYSETFWLEETKKIVDYIDRHGGKLDPGDPQIGVF